MRICKEKPIDGYYHCGNGETINGVRYCSEYGIKMQIDYAGHTFCAYLGKEDDDKQLRMELPTPE